MGWKLVVAVVENSAKLEAEEDLRTEDQHARPVERNFDLLCELHTVRCGKRSGISTLFLDIAFRESFASLSLSARISPAPIGPAKNVLIRVAERELGWNDSDVTRVSYCARGHAVIGSGGEGCLGGKQIEHRSMFIPIAVPIGEPRDGCRKTRGSRPVRPHQAATGVGARAGNRSSR